MRSASEARPAAPAVKSTEDMLDKLEAIKARFEDLGVALSNPEVVSDNRRFSAMSKEYRSIEKIVQAYEEYKDLLDTIEFNKEALAGDDAELRDLAKAEAAGLEERKQQIEAHIRQLLIPKDPQDEKNAILEIRAGTGGDEASLFAGDLLRMYIKYCEKKGWKTAILSESEGTVGGYKEVQVEVVGDDVYGTLKFESGVHRVQRVPDTETSGRVHTSAATVAAAALSGPCRATNKMANRTVLASPTEANRTTWPPRSGGNWPNAASAWSMAAGDWA